MLRLKLAWPDPLIQTFTTSWRLLRRNASSEWLKVVVALFILTKFAKLTKKGSTVEGQPLLVI